MSVNWTVESLDSIAEMATDKVSINDLTVANYLSTENMLPNRGGVEIAQKIPSSGNVNAFQMGDVLFSNIRTYFKKVWLASSNGGASADVVIFRPRDKQKIQSQYLFYLISSDAFIESTVTTSKGTKMPRGDKDAMRNYEFSLPPLATQQRIAGILSAYDELIENSQQRIKILESMARTLYREWFVYFRYPGHESVPLAPSSLGDIPQGWEVEKLGEKANVLRGRSYRSVDLSEDSGLPFLNLKCLVRDGGFRRTGLKLYTGDFKENNVVKKGDIVMAVTDMTQERRIVARAAIVPTLEGGFGIFSMDLVRVEPKPEFPKLFLYSLLRYSTFADEVKQHANGANVLHLPPDRITDYRFAVPTSDLMVDFATFVTPLVEEIDVLSNKVDNLRRTRDLLLPRLLSGQIDVEIAS